MARHKVLSPGPPRTFAVVLDAGASVTDELAAFAAANGVRAAAVTAIGGFGTATLGFFDLAEKDYERIPVDEQAEVLSLVGDLGRDVTGEVALHAHAVLGLRDGATRGGHLLSATVRPSLEVIVTESAAELRRTYREELGLALIELDDDQDTARGTGFDPEAPLRGGLSP